MGKRKERFGQGDDRNGLDVSFLWVGISGKLIPGGPSRFLPTFICAPTGAAVNHPDWLNPGSIAHAVLAQDNHQGADHLHIRLIFPLACLEERNVMIWMVLCVLLAEAVNSRPRRIPNHLHSLLERSFGSIRFCKISGSSVRLPCNDLWYKLPVFLAPCITSVKTTQRKAHGKIAAAVPP